MSLAADINGQQFTVTPRTRLEALATRPDSHRYIGSAIIAAAFAVLGTGYAAISPQIMGAPAEALIAALALALSLLALVVGMVIHRRLQALQRDPEAWTAPPTLGQGSAQAPWGSVFHVPRNVMRGVVVVATLWLLGILLMSSPGATVQMIGGAAMLPGAVLLLLVNVTCAWVAFSALIYLLWSLVSGTARASTSADRMSER